MEGLITSTAMSGNMSQASPVATRLPKGRADNPARSHLGAAPTCGSMAAHLVITEGNGFMASQLFLHGRPANSENVSLSDAEIPDADRWLTPGGIPVTFHAEALLPGRSTTDRRDLWLHQEHARLSLLRGFDELLCLEGLHGVEHLPHQIETVRKVLRHFRGRVLLADEVGLGKTIEACLLLREYLLRGMARRVLILVPSPLVSQWHEELVTKFDLDFTVPPRGVAVDRAEFWTGHDRVLTSLAFVKTKKRAALVAAEPWDLVIVDEAHHCKNRATLNWQLVNSLQRRFMFLLSATPVQNNLLELYNLLTLLAPGHLRTESDFKKQYVRRGNPRDPQNRDRLRSFLGEVMVRNTRSLVQLNLPERYAQTVQARPEGAEAELYRQLTEYLRRRGSGLANGTEPSDEVASTDVWDTEPSSDAAGAMAPVSRLQLSSLLAAQGSHPVTVAAALERIAAADPQAGALAQLAASIGASAKDSRLFELIEQSQGHKLLIFVNFRRTLAHIQRVFQSKGLAFSVFSGDQTAREKDEAVAAFRDSVPIMLCTESGGEGRNLQFADTLINYDLPWNPMKIEQRIGRVHRFGQTREVFVFNLCNALSLEARILNVLNEKIRMFELVVGEVGSILGNLEDGDQFESLVLNLWLHSRDDTELEQSFETLGETLLEAQEQYVRSKELDEALFGEDFQ
jgi:SNF2 family DNA or RNA helicase